MVVGTAAVAQHPQAVEPGVAPWERGRPRAGALLGEAAVEGARANVEINLRDITDPSYLDSIRRRLPT